MNFLIGALVLFSVLGGLLAQPVRYFPQFADGLVGEIRYQTTLKLVNAGSTTEIRIEFLAEDGQPLEVKSDALLGTISVIETTLEAAQLLSMATPGEGELRTGYVRLFAPESVSGTVIYSGTDARSGTVLFEAGVPATYPRRQCTVLLDSVGDRNSGLALVVAPTDVDRDAESTVVQITLFDRDGRSVASKDIGLARGEKIARFIHELFSGNPGVVGQALEMEGSLSIVSEDLPVAAVSLRQLVVPEPFPTSVPVLTTFPVAPRVVDSVKDPRERVMVFAPHPDDEVLGCAGVIRRAVKSGDEIKVVVATCGDAYRGAKVAFEEAFPSRSYDRDGDNDFDMLDYGIMRSGETLAAMVALGLTMSDVVFLGYPDAGIDNLWTSSEPFLSEFTGVSEVPDSYEFAFSVGAPYQRDSILSDIKALINEFAPTVLYSPTDTDHHQDHWALAKFVNQALLDLAPVRTWNAHFGYLIHWEANQDGWPGDSDTRVSPTGHSPADVSIRLSDFDFSEQEKRHLISLYESQVFVGETYLQGFAKAAEIFWLESW